jgi:hypothetical protein
MKTNSIGARNGINSPRRAGPSRDIFDEFGKAWRRHAPRLKRAADDVRKLVPQSVQDRVENVLRKVAGQSEPLKWDPTLYSFRESERKSYGQIPDAGQPDYASQLRKYRASERQSYERYPFKLDQPVTKERQQSVKQLHAE